MVVFFWQASLMWLLERQLTSWDTAILCKFNHFKNGHNSYMYQVSKNSWVREGDASSQLRHFEPLNSLMWQWIGECQNEQLTHSPGAFIPIEASFHMFHSWFFATLAGIYQAFFGSDFFRELGPDEHPLNKMTAWLKRNFSSTLTPLKSCRVQSFSRKNEANRLAKKKKQNNFSTPFIFGKFSAFSPDK